MKRGTDPEAARICSVYGNYQEDPASARRWDPSLFGNQAILTERRRRLSALLNMAAIFPLEERRVLDVGCGAGGTLRDWLVLGVPSENLYGADLLADRLKEGRSGLVNGTVCVADARSLPFPDETFDLISAFTLFSSVADPDVASEIAAEIRRVSIPDGWLLWYDMRYPNPRNRNVRAWGGKRIARLFPGSEIVLWSISVLPPLARSLRPRAGFLYGWLAKVPVLRSHYLGLICLDPSRSARAG